MTALERKQIRKAKALQKHLLRRNDERTKTERGYDDAVQNGVARSQPGCCIYSVMQR